MSLKQTLKQAKRLEKLANQQSKNSLSGDDVLRHAKDAKILNISVSREAVKPRNYLALNPLMQKGGVHEKEDVDIVRKKRRRETKQSLRQTDWLSEI